MRRRSASDNNEARTSKKNDARLLLIQKHHCHAFAPCFRGKNNKTSKFSHEINKSPKKCKSFRKVQKFQKKINFCFEINNTPSFYLFGSGVLHCHHCHRFHSFRTLHSNTLLHCTALPPSLPCTLQISQCKLFPTPKIYSYIFYLSDFCPVSLLSLHSFLKKNTFFNL